MARCWAFGMDSRIGEALLERGLANPESISSALSLQRQNGGKLGEILIGEGAVRYRDLYRALAAKEGLPFVDLLANPPETGLARNEEREDYLRLGLMPWKSGVVACIGISRETRKWAEKRFGPAVRYAITSPFDISRSVQSLFAAETSDTARFSLFNRTPIFSARVLCTRQELLSFSKFLLPFAIAFFIIPEFSLAALTLLLNLFFLAALSFKTLNFAAGRKKKQPETTLPADYELPVYSILIPLFREEKTLPSLLESIRRLDYPKSKLDVKLVLEEDDYLTYEAIKKLAPESYFEIIRVPYSEPRTKPKACNYALQFAHGEFVTIYDAEDLPEESQLKKALAKFAANPETGCVQARLNYFNHNANLLTRFFALEYAIWFDYLIPGLENLDMPIPLGGTSNHIPTRLLREAGGWDPFNVTEDADLGMRLACMGYKTKAINSITMEEAVESVPAWIKQRSRWIKGYMQTYIVHMRNAGGLAKVLGLRGFLGFQFFIGAPALVYFLGPVLWSVSLAALVADIPIPLPKFLVWFGNFNLILGFVSHVIMALIASSTFRDKHGKKLFGLSMHVSCFFFPFYIFLHSIACFRAMWQLVTRPHFWDKTEHGVSK